MWRKGILYIWDVRLAWCLPRETDGKRSKIDRGEWKKNKNPLGLFERGEHEIRSDSYPVIPYRPLCLMKAAKLDVKELVITCRCMTTFSTLSYFPWKNNVYVLINNANRKSRFTPSKWRLMDTNKNYIGGNYCTIYRVLWVWKRNISTKVIMTV